MKRYSEDHLWIDYDRKQKAARVGMTSFAVAELGDIAFIELPVVGVAITQGESLCVIESAKAAIDVITPVGGTVIEANATLDEKPGLLNASPEQEGWICRIGDVDEQEMAMLMSETDYELFTAEDEIEG